MTQKSSFDSRQRLENCCANSSSILKGRSAFSECLAAPSFDATAATFVVPHCRRRGAGVEVIVAVLSRIPSALMSGVCFPTFRSVRFFGTCGSARPVTTAHPLRNGSPHQLKRRLNHTLPSSAPLQLQPLTGCLVPCVHWKATCYNDHFLHDICTDLK